MICLIFHNVRRSVFLKSCTRKERRKRMKPGIGNEGSLTSAFLPLDRNLMFHLLQVDIIISSWECSLILPPYYLQRTCWLSVILWERVGRVPCTIRVVTCFIFLDLVLLYLTDLFIGFKFVFWMPLSSKVKCPHHCIWWHGIFSNIQASGIIRFWFKTLSSGNASSEYSLFIRKEPILLPSFQNCQNNSTFYG